MPPSQFIVFVSGPNRVGIGSRMDPGAFVFQKPSKRTMPTRRKVARDDRTDGTDRTFNDMNVVGRMLIVSIFAPADVHEEANHFERVRRDIRHERVERVAKKDHHCHAGCQLISV